MKSPRLDPNLQGQFLLKYELFRWMVRVNISWDNLTFNSKTTWYKVHRVDLIQSYFFFIFPDATKQPFYSRLQRVVVERVEDVAGHHVVAKADEDVF